MDEASSVVTKVPATKAERLNGIELEAGQKVVTISEHIVEVSDTYEAPGIVAERTRTLKVVDVYELPGTEGRDLLRQVRNRWQLAEDGSKGVMSFDHSMPAAQFVMSDGTVMTPAEIAEQRGEKWSPEQELGVVFRSGVRAAWPDDWGAAGAHSLPGVGGFMQVPGQEPGYVEQVVELRDALSDEVVAAWTDADEEAREAAEAAKEDREAHEQLLAARDEAQADDDGPADEDGDDEAGW